MGRRTAWWRAGAWRGRPSARARVAAVAAVLCTAAAASWPAGAAAAAGTPSTDVSSVAPSYAFAQDARSVDGAKGITDAQRLEAGKTYRSSLSRDAKVYYSLDLDAASNAYVSVTAVPRAGATLSVTDGIRVSVQDDDNHSCSNESARFGAARSPHPITAWGARTTSPADPVCQGVGIYYVVVERVGTADSSPGAWDLELTAATEPHLKQDGSTSPPTVWNSASPTPVSGEAKRSQGGAGFSRAASVGRGVWNADISPGQTLFYKVPVDWGQQPSATAELGSANGDVHGYAIDALALTLYNPVRADVEDARVGYDGKQKSASLAPVPAVDYANRYAVRDQVNGMRFAGSYYLVVHLAAGVADKFGDGPFGLTLRVGVEGAAQDGPGYAGQSVPRNVFEVTAQDRQAAAEGGTGDADVTMKAVAAGGIGAGTVVLVVLGVWTVAARRRARVW
ncbi:hypothetical protein GCM10022403_031110 [Streptomyces coacervatus]|uniref:Secreted protein n=1 Tax=Streptomyces coacervatus TaxID=647381 RepID=A0ABP7HHH0_9ACTN|nr:hypothetical protein [Streptomyces coacervatus]MDF2271397.1 hypothetical protein [Streptomyces coacervatus]